MWELLQIFGICMILAFLSEQTSPSVINDRNEKEYIRKEKFFYFTMALIMAVFVGLRTWYNDTPTYKMAYEMMQVGPGHTIFNSIDWAIGENPGFNLVNFILRSLDVSAQSFFMFYSLVTGLIYLWFIRKYTSNIWLSVFFYFTMGCYTFTMAAIKQCVAVAFCLIAVDRAIENKWWQFVLWVLLASTFHPYAIMYLIVPFLMFTPWSINTLFMLLASAVVGFGLESMLGTIINITSMMGEEYDVSTFTGEGVNVFRLAVIWAPIILSLLAHRHMRESDDRTNNLIMNLSMLNAEIMFIALFGTANYFARLANYFLIFQTVSLPWMFKYFNEKSKKLLTVGTVVCYLLYFYYANAINQPFDNQFDRITLMEYFKIIMN